MKTRFLPLALPLLVLAPAAPAQDTGARAGTRADGPAPAENVRLELLTDRTADQQFTAQDLLGRDVHDRRGEKIGTVSDIELGAGFPTQLALALGQSQSARDPRAAPGDRPPTGSMSSSPTHQAGAPDRAHQPAVFISVGGIFGLGAQLVRAPANALRYDRDNNRVVLDVDREELTRVTEGNGPDASSSATAETGALSKLTDDDLQQDRQTLHEAVARDPQLQEVADRINLQVNDVDVVAFGTVHTQDQRQQLIALIERHTDKPVRDRLFVAPAVEGEPTVPTE